MNLEDIGDLLIAGRNNQLRLCTVGVLLRERFGVEAIYSEARAGAGGSKINFFLVPIADAGAEISKVLIELFQLPSVPPSPPSTND